MQKNIVLTHFIMEFLKVINSGLIYFSYTSGSPVYGNLTIKARIEPLQAQYKRYGQPPESKIFINYVSFQISIIILGQLKCLSLKSSFKVSSISGKFKTIFIRHFYPLMCEFSIILEKGISWIWQLVKTAAKFIYAAIDFMEMKLSNIKWIFNVVIAVYF